MSYKIYSETGTLISPETGTPYSLDELYYRSHKPYISEINRKEDSSDEVEQIDRRSLLLILFIISFIIGIFIYLFSM